MSKSHPVAFSFGGVEHHPTCRCMLCWHAGKWQDVAAEWLTTRARQRKEASENR